MSEEWGPWIEHDGGGMPVAAETFVLVEFRAPPEAWEINPWDAGALAGQLVWWHDGRNDDIIRFRIRKPRGMTILEELLENLPEEVTA